MRLALLAAAAVLLLVAAAALLQALASSPLGERLLRGGVRLGATYLPDGARTGDAVTRNVYAVFAPPPWRVLRWLGWWWRRARGRGSAGVVELSFFENGDRFRRHGVRVELVEREEDTVVVTQSLTEADSAALDEYARKFPLPRRRGT